MASYAECGGFMYLCRTLVDFEGRSWPMVGTLPAATTMTSKLTLGYRQVTARQASPLTTPGQQFWGHEFHRSTLTPTPAHPLYHLASYPLPGESTEFLKAEGWGSPQLHGSYIHVHWGDRPAMPQQFLNACRHWRNSRSRGATARSKGR
ncbi:MAG: hypothetical protein F6K42_29915 [Leptolyngbya sp. SIO1D8]|nr:hypothetical protein [Leptolyngbya sp. SIO1D8]